MVAESEQESHDSPPKKASLLGSNSDRRSDYEVTPEKKSLLQSFHESIIKSKKKTASARTSSNKKDSKEKQYHFEIRVETKDSGVYSRAFSAPEYGVQAISAIEGILLGAHY